MSWNLTFLLVHLLALYAFGKLAATAKCRSQQVIMSILTVAALILAIGFALRLHIVDGYIYVLWLGFLIEHIAVLLAASRLIYREFLCPPSGSRLYLSS